MMCTCTDSKFWFCFKILYKDEGKEDDEATNSVEEEKLDVHDMESKQHF